MDEDLILARYYRYMIKAYRLSPDVSEAQLGTILKRFYAADCEPLKDPDRHTCQTGLPG